MPAFVPKLLRKTPKGGLFLSEKGTQYYASNSREAGHVVAGRIGGSRLVIEHATPAAARRATTQLRRALRGVDKKDLSGLKSFRINANPKSNISAWYDQKKDFARFNDLHSGSRAVSNRHGVLHEIGHRVQWRADKKAYEDFRTVLRADKKKTIRAGLSKWRSELGDFPKNYAGYSPTHVPGELFSDAYALSMINMNRLRTVNEKAYDIFNQRLYKQAMGALSPAEKRAIKGGEYARGNAKALHHLRLERGRLQGHDVPGLLSHTDYRIKGNKVAMAAHRKARATEEARRAAVGRQRKSA